MTKKFKSILVTLCVGIVVLIALAVVMNVLENSDDGEGVVSQKQLTNYTVGNVASVKIQLSSGEYYYITENADTTTSDSSVVDYKITFNGIYAGLDYDTTLSKQIVSYACQLKAQRDLDVQEDLSYYALDNPSSVVTILLNDGTETHIYIGKAASGSTGYYCKVDGDDHVYLISVGNGESFIMTPNELRIKKFVLPTTIENVETAEWKYNDSAKVSIYRDLETTVFNPYLNYYVDSPWSKPMPINADIINSMFENMPTFYISDYITPKTDGTQASLADYGLDNAWGYFKIVLTDGTVYEFSFGDYSDDTEYNCYMLDHNTNQIYTIYHDRGAYLEPYTAVAITSPYVVMANLDDIESVVAEYGDKVSEFFHKRVSTGTNSDGEIIYENSYTLEGMTYSNNVMGLLYRNAIAIRIQNQYRGYEHEEEAMLTLTFTAFDVDVAPKVISFYKINDNLCVAEIDGCKDVMVSISDVQGYIDAIDMVKNGKTPPYKS